MPFAVVLYFDGKEEQAFLDIWKALAKEKLSANLFEAGIRPHITLAIYDELECQPCENELAKIASRTNPISFQISHLGVFTQPEPVVFAAPTLTEEFLDVHRSIHLGLVNKSKNPWERYLPDQWVPHCTLALGFSLDELEKILEKCLVLKFPLEIIANQVGVVEFQPMKDLFKYDLLSD